MKVTCTPAADIYYLFPVFSLLLGCLGSVLSSAAALANAPCRNARPTFNAAALFDGRGAGKTPPRPSTFSKFLQLSEVKKNKSGVRPPSGQEVSSTQRTKSV